MYLDRQMLAIIFKNFGFNSIEIEMLLAEYSDMLFEMVIMKIFNRYFATHSDEEKEKLEKEMARIKNTGDFEKQQEMIGILKDTMANNPDLAEEIRDEMTKFYSQVFFDFMKEATPEGQIEILTYMLSKKREIKKDKETFEDIVRKKKLLNPKKIQNSGSN